MMTEEEIEAYENILKDNFYNELKQAVHKVLDIVFDNITLGDNISENGPYFQGVSDAVSEIKDTVDCDWIAENVIYNRRSGSSK